MNETDSPLLQSKLYDAQSVFRPENLLREARRQKRLAAATVPEVCVLDPDGDLVRHLRAAGRAKPDAGWACYHTELFIFEERGETFGLVGCAVGAPFAVLVAEQLFASGCRLLVSVTSSGQIIASGPTPYFVLIERALRDEGTSYHYLPPAPFAEADPDLVSIVASGFAGASITLHRGATWTTDAPFRETQAAITMAQDRGLLAVEMEAAALYAFAQARGRAVVCFAHVTNTMAQAEGDFDKGDAEGATDALEVVCTATRSWRRSTR
jgi:uridine phosphorylase